MPFSNPELQAFAAGFPIALLHASISIVLLIVGAAVALRAVLDGVAALTAGERAVMREWLDRVAAG